MFRSALLGLILTGCGASVVSPAAVVTSPPYVTAPLTVGADAVTVMRGGEPTAARIRNLLARARAGIELEMYELGRDDLLGALIDAHRRGVAITVIVDPSVDVSAVSARRLRAPGIEVLDYPVRTRMIDHVKLLVVDHAVAVVGGINWGAGSFANHDFDVELQGPAVTNLERVFVRDVITTGRTATVPPAVDDPAIVVATTEPAAEIRPLALDTVNSARGTLDLDLYVLTDSGIVHGLERSVARGVAVRVLLDPNQHPSDAAAVELEAAGVAVRRYRGHGEKLHAKVAVADATRVLMGSANWSSGGFRSNHELDVEMPAAAPVAAAITAQFEADWAASA